eukprot:COSAG01_NODE_52367_length_347_cov_0.637097_1_plen_68_part_01
MEFLDFRTFRGHLLGFIVTFSNLCTYTSIPLLYRYYADMGLKNVSLCRGYAVMPHMCHYTCSPTLTLV